MKTLKFLLVVATLTATISSCLKKQEDPPIYVKSHTQFVLQEKDGDGYRYLPHIGFWYDGKEEFARGEILLNDVPMNEPKHDAGLKVYQINPAANAVASLTELNGIYTTGPIGVNGHDWLRQSPVAIEFKDANILGEVRVTAFGCEDGRVYATFDKTSAANAVAYGFYLQPYSNGKPTEFYAMPMNQYLDFAKNLNEAATQTVEFYLSKLLYVADYFLITPAAFNYSENTLTVMRLAVGQDGTANVSRVINYDDASDFSTDFTAPVEP